MSSDRRSSLLVGRVMHERLSPQRHGFRYRLYMHRLVLDELPALAGRLGLLGINRPRPSAFFEADHLAAAPGTLRQRVETVLREHGITRTIGDIELVTQCRVFGYVFNPVSFFFCYGQDDSLAAVIAEVTNTFGESHAYVLTPNLEIATAKKVFHVSPFMTLDGTYRFAFDISQAHLDVRIDLYRQGTPIFVSRLSLDRRPLTDRGLALALVRYPLVTLAVIGRIHWQALRLWWKGATYYPKPPLDPDAARTGST
ncbi:MAG: DUF1365 domain-containing protein, partial [Acidobacteriota bacterium]|nr:DUF1365 domain-containing protein [Acidobacteriota bacterium]